MHHANCTDELSSAPQSNVVSALLLVQGSSGISGEKELGQPSGGLAIDLREPR